MRDYMTLNPKELMVLSDEGAALSRVCTELKESFLEKKTIPEKDILDFCRLICQRIYDGLTESMPKSFDDLAETADDYWKYHFLSGRNQKLDLSYIRVYQITNMIRIFTKDRSRELALLEAVEANKKYITLLKLIYNHPDIQHKQLSEKLGISSSMLSQRMSKLEASGIVMSRRIGSNKYYKLSRFGLDLYLRMNSQKDGGRGITIWTIDRMYLLVEMLKFLYSQENPVQLDTNSIVSLVKRVATPSDEDIKKYIKKGSTYDNYRNYSRKRIVNKGQNLPETDSLYRNYGDNRRIKMSVY